MQELIKGKHSIKLLREALDKKGSASVFLITGSHFANPDILNSNLGEITTHFIKKGVNTSQQEAEEALELYNNEMHDTIIAIGGGSVIDLAKAVIFNCIALNQKMPFLAVAPTTAGSGTEATTFAVVYRGKKKLSLDHPDLLPSLVVLDPALTYSLPSFQTAVSGIDVFAQAVESYWNIHATSASREFAAEAIAIWREYFLQSVTNPDDLSREQMMTAAHLAGKAINLTRTTGPHAFSYYLTAHYGIPHGQAVALFLPLFFEYNNPEGKLLNLLGVSSVPEAIDMIRRVIREAGLALDLSSLGIDRDELIGKLLDDVNQERFSNNPVQFDRDRLMQLFSANL